MQLVRRPQDRATLRDGIKRIAARTAAHAPQARYDSCLLMLSHMRATTTALSNVLCSHPRITGYGETHVPHGRAESLGQVVVNLALRRALSLRADLLYDKVLHDHLDAAADAPFFGARALFMLRAPAPAIRSIEALARRTDMHQYRSAEAAALYYAERVETLCGHWDRFPATRRFGVTSEALLRDPDATVARLGAWLRLEPPLTNSYVSHRATQKGGGGDPTRSASHTQIEPSDRPVESGPVAGVSAELASRCEAAHGALAERFMANSGPQPEPGPHPDLSNPQS
ncbi:sulfotransferase family protein [Limimaricola soesokkakensis]|uniref:Sulfotransferase family protein n=1 Tax=Limimaricola soesokkakensis TaxID=1343159 RepID=A0A1X6ZYS8_9RHOB|nr:sulfotransferase [Limimaricola soesokkakensis]PSK82495.1 sulfotransferase family protein [Limimaricola soesokkakensis]SLN65296.1 hypothetical protein LOS8367_03208 [Limimaricola soesokkakensis]